MFQTTVTSPGIFLLLSSPLLHTHIHRLAAFSHKLKQLFTFTHTHSSIRRHSVPQPHLQVQRHLQIQAFYMMFRNVVVADRGGWNIQNLHTEKGAVPSQWRRDGLAQRGASIIKALSIISHLGTSLVVQWIRICLPMQETWVWSLVQEDSTCHGATMPVSHSYWPCAPRPRSHNYWSLSPRAHAPHKKPQKWEACTPQHHPSKWGAPTCRN